MSYRTIIAISLLLLGLALIANPYYLWPHHGDEQYELRVGVTAGGTEENSVPIETLPSETATAVETAIEAYETDTAPPVYEGRDAIPTTGLKYDSGRPAVTVNDTDYVVLINKQDRSPPLLSESPFIRAAMGFAGSVAMTLGAVAAVTGSVRLTTRRAWIVVPVLGLVLGSTIAYDGGVDGVAITGTRASPVDVLVGTRLGTALGVLLWLLPAIGLVIGVAFRRRRWRDGSTAIGEPLCVLAFVVVTWLFTVPGILLGVLVADENR